MTTIVIDLGCCDHPNGEVSTEPLLARFEPTIYFGFDPLLHKDQTSFSAASKTTSVHFRREAAWIYEGQLVLSRGNALDATALHHSSRWNDSSTLTVPCFDFPQWLYDLDVSADGPGDLIVKMDVEGAEFMLLERIRNRDLDLKITLLLIEWHDRFFSDGEARRAQIEPRLRCEMEPWQ